MSKYDIQLIKFSKLSEMVKVPEYQRGLKWGEQKRVNFLENIKKGYPFGSILIKEVHEIDSLNNIHKKYLLLDGLQRYSTLELALKNPEIIMCKDDYMLFAKEAYKKLCIQDNMDAQREMILEEICEILRNSISGADFAEKLEKKHAFAEKWKYHIPEIFTDKEKYKKEIIDFSNLQIPAISFSGENSELVEIFQALNEGGITLSKYDVFAASWSSKKKFIFEKYDIVDTIAKRYEKMYEDVDIEIDGFDADEFRKEKEINLFEFCYALGKNLSQKFSIIAGKKSLADVESIGFSILAVSLKISLKHVDKIEDKIEHMNDTFLMDLYESIFKIFKDIQDELEKFTKCVSQNIFIYKEMQMVSMFAELFHHRYLISNSEGFFRLDIIKKYKIGYENALENISLYYLYDNLDGTWTSNGDVKVDDIVQNSNFKYGRKVSWMQFDSRINSYLYEERQKSNIRIRKETKLIMSYLIRDEIEKLEKKLDFEHIVPVNKCSKLSDFSGSSLGNICVLSSYTNRMKKDATLYEIKRGNEFVLDKNILSYSRYPTESEIDFIHGLIDENNITQKSKMAKNFVETREKQLLNDFFRKYENKFKA